jgi:hypothetical protein
MKERVFTLPEIGLIAGTRVALGLGVGLLLASKLNDQKREGAGWALLAVGALTTIPLLLNVFGKARSVAPRPSRTPEPALV